MQTTEEQKYLGLGRMGDGKETALPPYIYTHSHTERRVQNLLRYNLREPQIWLKPGGNWSHLHTLSGHKPSPRFRKFHGLS